MAGIDTIIKIVVGLILFSAIITFFGTAYISTADSYDVSYSDDFNSTFNKLGYTNNITQELAEEVRGGEGSQGDSSTIDTLWRAGYSSLLLSWNSYGVMQDVGQKVQQKLGIHPIFFTVFLSIFIFIMTISIISILFKVL